ncbi:hypothetical protein GSU75_01639 [Pseudomonas savastanoi pv. phaseolicola]|nr:hypothetical protein [Pseudomonas savastanoi pv. phaseolicola]
MIAQDHHALVTQVRDQSFTLAQVQRNAFVTVIGHTPGEGNGVLGNRQQPVLLRRHCDTVTGVGVQHRLQVMARSVNGTVNHVTGVVDTQPCRVIDNRAVDVDLD